MKNQILTLVIGILVGAIISTGIFIVVDNNKSKKQCNNKVKIVEQHKKSILNESTSKKNTKDKTSNNIIKENKKNTTSDSNLNKETSN